MTKTVTKTHKKEKKISSPNFKQLYIFRRNAVFKKLSI